MGDNLLMKTFFMIMTILFTVSLSSNELSWVNEQVEAIKPPRTGMKSRELAVLKDPFIFLNRNKTSTKSSPSKTKKSSVTSPRKVVKKRTALSVTMLMNSSAMINGKWYRIGDKINGYSVSKIDSTSVLLTKNKKKLLLSTNSKSKNLNFNNK